MMNDTTEKEIREDVDELKKEADEILKDTEEIKEEVDEIRDEVKEIKEEVTRESKEQEDFKSKYLYLAAEMDNMRRRFERDREQLLKYGNEKILGQLVEVVDNLDRTLDALAGETDDKVKNIVTGVEMVRTQFLEILKGNGLEAIESLGRIFDPNFHEAMAQQPAEGKEDQEIIQEYQKGYMLNGRLLRAAKVIVAKND